MFSALFDGPAPEAFGDRLRRGEIERRWLGAPTALDFPAGRGRMVSMSFDEKFSGRQLLGLEAMDPSAFKPNRRKRMASSAVLR